MSSVFDHLEQEWERLAGREPSAALADLCADVGAGNLGGLVDRLRTAPPSSADHVLARLAERAAVSDAAARVLLQFLLPGTCRLAASWWALGDADERAAAAVAAVYQRIRTYPIGRRPTKIAANIFLDARQDLWRAARKATRDATRVVAVDPQALPLPSTGADPNAAEELAELLAEAVAAGRIGAADASVIASARINDARMADLAAERGVNLRTLQWRRQRAEAALVRAGSAA